MISLPFLYREHETPNDVLRLTSFGVRRYLVRFGFEVSTLRKVGIPLYTAYSLINERAIKNGEHSSASIAGRVLSKAFRSTLLPLLNATLFSRRPTDDDGVYHHLLVSAKKVGSR